MQFRIDLAEIVDDPTCREVGERSSGAWSTRVSSYRKLRLAPEAVRHAFETAGLRANLEPGPRGMVKLVADA